MIEEIYGLCNYLSRVQATLYDNGLSEERRKTDLSLKEMFLEIFSLENKKCNEIDLWTEWIKCILPISTNNYALYVRTFILNCKSAQHSISLLRDPEYCSFSHKLTLVHIIQHRADLGHFGCLESYPFENTSTTVTSSPACVERPQYLDLCWSVTKTTDNVLLNVDLIKVCSVYCTCSSLDHDNE